MKTSCETLAIQVSNSTVRRTIPGLGHGLDIQAGLELLEVFLLRVLFRMPGLFFLGCSQTGSDKHLLLLATLWEDDDAIDPTFILHKMEHVNVQTTMLAMQRTLISRVMPSTTVEVLGPDSTRFKPPKKHEVTHIEMIP